MRRLFASACVLGLVGAVISGCAMAPHGDLTTNGGYCHVMGDPVDLAEASVNSKMYSDFEGKRYLFCCKGCKKKFENNPVKWITNPAPPETGVQ